MTLTLADLVADPSKYDQLKIQGKKCSECKKEFSPEEHQAEEVMLKQGKIICIDCYYDEDTHREIWP